MFYNNSDKTSIAPISSKRIKLNGAPSTGVGQTHSPCTMQNSSTNDLMEWKLREKGKSEKVSFQKVMKRNYAT